MKFKEFEELMSGQGITSLADIARALDSSPQAVSNWKSRDQVPHHVVAKINILNLTTTDGIQYLSEQDRLHALIGKNKIDLFKDNTISVSDILLVISKQLKLIFITTFMLVFTSFTYVQFVQTPKYVSTSTVLLPENQTTNLGGLSGLASQFGLSIPVAGQTDLSSPAILPDIVASRTFAEKILYKKFYTKKFEKELTLLSILTHGDKPPELEENLLVTEALSNLADLIEFNRGISSPFSQIKVTTFEADFSKKLANEVLIELEQINRYFKIQSLDEKITFINQRINSVEKDLKKSEQRLKLFNEQNRQINSPSLVLEQERLDRDVEIQKGIFLTLKQQLELAKIEEVQEANILQVLDYPQLAIGPSNKNLKKTILIATIIGLGIGIFLAFIRSYLEKPSVDDRKNFKKIRHFLINKSIDVFMDHRITGIMSFLLILCLPLYIGYESKNPVYFDRYSARLFQIIILYISFLLFLLVMFGWNLVKRRKT